MGGCRIDRTLAQPLYREDTESGLSQRPLALLEEFTKEVNSVMADFDSRNTPIRVYVARSRSRISRWAVGLATFVAGLAVLFGCIFAIAYANKGSTGFSDNWVGFLGAVALFVGIVVALIAFVLAITAKIQREKWTWLWLPLIAFPVLLAFIVIGDLLWWQ